MQTVEPRNYTIALKSHSIFDCVHGSKSERVVKNQVGKI